jgi:hypothetical protein
MPEHVGAPLDADALRILATIAMVALMLLARL